MPYSLDSSKYDSILKYARQVRFAHKHYRLNYTDLSRIFNRYGWSRQKIKSIIEHKSYSHPSFILGGEWRYVAYLHSSFYVNREGRCWSTAWNKEVGGNTGGYRCVGVNNGSHVINVKIGWLVLAAFDRIPEKWEVIRHLDDVRDNDRLENIKWGHHYENSTDSKENKRMKSTNQKLTDQQILELVRNYDKSVHGGVKAYAQHLRDSGMKHASNATIVRIFRGVSYSSLTGIKRRSIDDSVKPFSDKDTEDTLRSYLARPKGETDDRFVARTVRAYNKRGFKFVEASTILKIIQLETGLSRRLHYMLTESEDC